VRWVGGVSPGTVKGPAEAAALSLIPEGIGRDPL
jgi:hypothetical protein